jgi:hypothetical protein
MCRYYEREKIIKMKLLMVELNQFSETNLSHDNLLLSELKWGNDTKFLQRYKIWDFMAIKIQVMV